MSFKKKKESLNHFLFTIFEIKFMEIHSFDQVSHRFWLESSQMWITNFPETITRLNRLHEKKKRSAKWSHVYPLKSPLLMVSINCSVTLMISCRLNRTPSSSSMLLVDSVDSFAFSSDNSFAFATTLLPVRNVYFITKVL